MVSSDTDGHFRVLNQKAMYCLSRESLPFLLHKSLYQSPFLLQAKTFWISVEQDLWRSAIQNPHLPNARMLDIGARSVPCWVFKLCWTWSMIKICIHRCIRSGTMVPCESYWDYHHWHYPRNLGIWEKHRLILVSKGWERHLHKESVLNSLWSRSGTSCWVCGKTSIYLSTLLLKDVSQN